MLCDLKIINILIFLPINVYNDIEAVVKWSRNQTTKGLRHIQMQENAIREQYQAGQINVLYIAINQSIRHVYKRREKYRTLSGNKRLSYDNRRTA